MGVGAQGKRVSFRHIFNCRDDSLVEELGNLLNTDDQAPDLITGFYMICGSERITDDVSSMFSHYHHHFSIG